MNNPSLRSLVFSLMIASSLVSLSSSSYAMDPMQAHQPITEIAIHLQELKNLEAKLKDDKEKYEAAHTEFLAWKGENHTKEELNEKQESCKGAIAVTENDIKTQITNICHLQMKQLKLAKKEFKKACDKGVNIDSWENKSDSLLLVTNAVVHGTKLMEEVESSLLGNREVEEKLRSVKYVYADAKGFPEYLSDILKQIDNLKLAKQKFEEAMGHLTAIESSEDRKKLFKNAQDCQMSGTKLMEEIESSYARYDMRIQNKLASLKTLQLEVTGMYDKKLSLFPPISTALPTLKSEEDAKPTVLQQIEKLALAKEIYNDVMMAPFPWAQTNILQGTLSRLRQWSELLAEVESSGLRDDSQIQEELGLARMQRRDVEGMYKFLKVKLSSEKVIASPPLSGVKIEEKEKPVVAAVFQIPTVATPAPKPEEVMPVVMTAPTPVVRPALERGTPPPPPPGPLVPGQKGRASKPVAGNSEAANPQTPKGSANPNSKAPPADLMAQIREAQQQRAAKQIGEQVLGKTPIPQIPKDVPQIERPTKVVSRLGTPSKKDSKGGNILTASSESVDLSKPLSPIELDVQALELKLAVLDKTDVEKHNVEKAAIYEKLKVTLTKVREDKANDLKKLQNDLHTLQEKFEELPQEEKSKRVTEHAQDRKDLSAKIKIAEKEYTKSFAKKIESKIQCLAWKNEESMRMRAIRKSSRADLISILEKREQEIQQKRDDYKSQWRYIDERRGAGDKVNVLQPLRFKAGELETEIKSLEKLQECDEANKRELRRLIKYSKAEVEENTKQIGVLENKRQAGPLKKTEESAVPDVMQTLLQSIVKQKGKLALDSLEEDDAQGFHSDDVPSGSLTPELTPEEEAEKRVKRAAAEKVAKENADYQAKIDKEKREKKTDQASLAEERAKEEAKKGFSMKPPSTLRDDEDDDGWPD